jgi:UDP-N-acetylglucosamine enolpyruvyl transferase
VSQVSTETAVPVGSDEFAGVDTVDFFGGKPLLGSVDVRGAKNLVTKAMVAALLADQPSVLGNVPRISDVAVVRGFSKHTRFGHRQRVRGTHP